MRKASLGGALIGGLLVASPAAMAQTNVAYATAPRSDYVVFFDRGTDHLSGVAADTVRRAAEAAKSSRTVLIAGRPDRVAAVKSELERAGVPARAIIASRDAARPSSSQANDGISDPASRRVEITF